MKEWQSKYILLLITLIFVFSSCSNGLTDMFDSYNGNFTSADLVKTDNPGSPGFDASMMLPPCYAVRDDEKLNLAAPPGCDTYSWAIFSRDETLISKTDDSSTFNQRIFCGQTDQLH